LSAVPCDGAVAGGERRAAAVRARVRPDADQRSRADGRAHQLALVQRRVVVRDHRAGGADDRDGGGTGKNLKVAACEPLERRSGVRRSGDAQAADRLDQVSQPRTRREPWPFARAASLDDCRERVAEPLLGARQRFTEDAPSPYRWPASTPATELSSDRDGE